MNALDAWRSRPMQVRVLEPCPRCKQLAEGVEERIIYGAWLQKFKETCCAACAPAVQREYLEGCVG
jgi:hypothetical protein